MNQQTRASLSDIGIEVRSPTEKVERLSGGERQSIAIGRALHFGAKLLILDEPTSALSVGETRKVLNYTLNAKERGLSVIFITHNIHHVYMVADRYTIIRHGKLVGNYLKSELTETDIADLITGVREA
jgi:simple sugar transport system ATP-binding protein